MAIIAAICGAVSAFIGKAKGDWKVWGVVGVICVLVSALCLRTVFNMTGVSIYPFFKIRARDPSTRFARSG